MALSLFEDKSKIPDSEDLSNALGICFPLWNQIKEFVAEHYPAAMEEWKHSGKNYGWGFRLRDKKRAIVYLTPGDKYFLFSMVMGEKATLNAMNSKISKEIKAIIEAAPVYAEGRGFRIEVKDSKFIKDIKELILIKLAH
jgi:hypothetical protein